MWYFYCPCGQHDERKWKKGSATVQILLSDSWTQEDNCSIQTKTQCCLLSFLTLVLLVVIECDDYIFCTNRFMVCSPCSVATVTETAILSNCIVTSGTSTMVVVVGSEGFIELVTH